MAVVRGRQNPRHMTFAERLRRARKAANMLPAELSRAAGLNKNAVSLLEGGPSLPTLTSVSKLAKALKLAPGFLAYGLGDAAAPADAELPAQSLAERARAARLAQNLSVMELGRRSELTEGAVRSIESGRTPLISTLEAVALGLGLSPSWLAYGEGPMTLPKRGSRPGVSSFSTNTKDQ